MLKLGGSSLSFNLLPCWSKSDKTLPQLSPKELFLGVTMANHLRNFNYAFREVDKFVKNSKEAVEARRNTKQIMSNLNRFFSDNGNKGNFCRATISGELPDL